MDTFTQIIFPQKIKSKPALPLFLPAPVLTIEKKNKLNFWMKEVFDHNTKITKIFVMIQCPECNLIYEFMEIGEKQKELIRECISTNPTYYKDSARISCPRCIGNISTNGGK